MSYIMLPGMGELGAASVSKAQAEVDRWQKQIAREKGKNRTNKIVLMVYQKNLKKAQQKLAEAKRAAQPKPSSGSGSGMQNMMQSALNMVKPQQTSNGLPPPPASRDEGNWREQSKKQALTQEQLDLREKLPTKFKPSTSTGNGGGWSSSVQLPSTRSTDMSAPQDISIATPPVEEKITPPAQMQDRQIPEQTYVDIPPAEQIHTPGQKRGIDKRILIGGGLAAAGLVAVFALMD